MTEEEDVMVEIALMIATLGDMEETLNEIQYTLTSQPFQKGTSTLSGLLGVLENVAGITAL